MAAKKILCARGKGVVAGGGYKKMGVKKNNKNVFF